MSGSRSWFDSPPRWLLVFGAVVLHLALALPIAGRQGINWDEHTDLEIAASYLQGPRAFLVGSGSDSITTRLPMFLVAVLDLAGIDLSLSSARLASVTTAVVTLLGAYVLACLLFDRRKAAVGLLILATSPYFVSASPMAFSEGDITAAAAVPWIAVAAVFVQRNPTWWRSAALGILLGLGVSAKFSGVVLLPAVALTVLLPTALSMGRPVSGWRPWLALALGTAGWLLAHIIATGAALQAIAAWLPGPLRSGAVRLLLAGCGWVALVAWSWQHRSERASPAGVIVLPLVAAGLTFFTIPPAHTANPFLFLGLWRASFSSAGGLDLGFVAESAIFHFLIVLLKSGLVVGVLLWAGALRAVASWRSRPEVRLPVAMLAFHAAFLLLLPLAQVRYVIPVFALFVILGADLVVDIGRARPKLAPLMALLMAVTLAVDYRLCYPDLSLNGYQWLGTRYFAGRTTVGYRGVAQWGEDGVEQAVRWCEQTVPPGATVASYVSARPIVAWLLPAPPFRLLDGLEHRDAMNQADYVLTSLNGDLVDGDGPLNPVGDPFKFPSYDRRALERDFVRVFSVKRAFGLEVATVWQRR